MTENISARRGTLIAGFSALALLVLIAAFDNQGTRSWRQNQVISDHGDTAHSWTSLPVQALSAFDWRATPADGEPTRIFWGALTSALLGVILLFLLVSLVCRGVAAGRGRWALFTGSWFATAAAAGLAVTAGSAVAGASLVLSAPNDATRWSRGDTYYGMLMAGALFGLFAGWLIGLIAVITYGITQNVDTPSTSADRSWGPSSGYDYGSPAPAPTSGADYSFSPGSPYSSPSSASSSSASPYSPSSSTTPERGDQEASASAPTQQIVPPRENDPYGGDNRSY